MFSFTIFQLSTLFFSAQQSQPPFYFHCYTIIFFMLDGLALR